MSYREIAEKYIDIFKLLMISAGKETGNTSYSNVNNIIKGRWSDMIEHAIDDEVDFRIFIGVLIYAVVIDVHGAEELSKTDDEDTYEMIEFIWESYLQGPTRKFCRKYGLDIPGDQLGIGARLIIK